MASEPRTLHRVAVDLRDQIKDRGTAPWQAHPGVVSWLRVFEKLRREYRVMPYHEFRRCRRELAE